MPTFALLPPSGGDVEDVAAADDNDDQGSL